MRVPAFAVLLLFAASICVAQTSEKAQEIPKLLVAMDSVKNVEATWDAILPQMSVSLKRVFTQALEKDKGEKAENVDAAVAVFADEFRKQLNSQQLIERVVVPIYEERFTADEVHQMRLFYESPVGKKLASNTPQMVQETVAKTQTLAQEIIGRLLANAELRNRMEAILRGETTK